MRTAAPCSITAPAGRRATSALPAANSAASSVNPSAEPSSYPQIPRTRQFYWQERFGHLQAGRKDWRRNRETVYRHFWGGSRDTRSEERGTSLSKRNWFAA